MLTDVTLTDKDHNRRIIIDAKYYVDTLVNRFNDINKIRREHISQIMSYVLNQENTNIPYTAATNGILVYPQTDEPIFETYRYSNSSHYFRACTVDLNMNWQEIDKRLREIIDF